MLISLPQYDTVYDMNNGLDNGRYNDFGYESGSRMSVSGTAGSTALYHHNGTKYGLGIGARPNGDGKMKAYWYIYIYILAKKTQALIL